MDISQVWAFQRKTNLIHDTVPIKIKMNQNWNEDFCSHDNYILPRMKLKINSSKEQAKPL